MPRRLPFPALVLSVAVASFGTTAGVATALVGEPRKASPAAKKQAKAKTRTVTITTRSSPRGRRGARGFTGRQGPAGPEGERGAPGVQGATGPSQRPLHQHVTVNWQNGKHAGRDRASFTVPGVGTGEIVCSPDTQYINLTQADRALDSTMWTMKAQTLEDGRTETIVRASRHERFSGPQFNEGFNRYNGEPRSSGSFVGIISSRGHRDAPGGPAAPPTSFRLSWHWTFDDSFGPRCYVAARFLTGPS